MTDSALSFEDGRYPPLPPIPTDPAGRLELASQAHADFHRHKAEIDRIERTYKLKELAPGLQAARFGAGAQMFAAERLLTACLQLVDRRTPALSPTVEVASILERAGQNVARKDAA